MRRLSHMVGIKSVKRGLKYEDEAVRMDMEANARLLYGGSDGEEAIKPTAGADDMELMSGRDLTVHNHYHTAPTAPAPAPVSETAPPATEPEPESLAWKALKTGSLIAAGATTALALPPAIEAVGEWLTPEPTVITQPAEPRGVIGIELGKPQ